MWPSVPLAVKPAAQPVSYYSLIIIKFTKRASFAAAVLLWPSGFHSATRKDIYRSVAMLSVLYSTVQYHTR